MYEIAPTGQFKKDFKSASKRRYDITKLEDVLNILQSGKKLPRNHKNHKLAGNYTNHFECHIAPDWLLIYIKDDKKKLITLVRTGTHSDLFE